MGQQDGGNGSQRWWRRVEQPRLRRRIGREKRGWRVKLRKVDCRWVKGEKAVGGRGWRGTREEQRRKEVRLRKAEVAEEQGLGKGVVA
ncbi:hypothetical protein AMTR_s00031p00109390 [Amborella trichopoda]|uniref:Uncharacterized protein n=1 Tax=Amborella trichopoda TaxID=13333 RepID=U5D549_AMBTC|nr:hypothetical protein AMTR_s00031p00109390 [Amborella trichopoda]